MRACFSVGIYSGDDKCNSSENQITVKSVCLRSYDPNKRSCYKINQQGCNGDPADLGFALRIDN